MASDLKRGEIFLGWSKSEEPELEEPRRVLDIRRPRGSNEKIKVVLDTPEEILMGPEIIVFVEDKNE